MTVGVGIRVPGQGAVLACDSRITDPASGEIFTDAEHKWGVFGSAPAVYAGVVGDLWDELRRSPPRNISELRERIRDLQAQEHGRDYGILCYDRAKDRLLGLSHQGEATQMGVHYTIGCGGALALGVLDAAKAPTSLEAAAKLATRAVKITCRRNAFCGGRIRVLIAPRRGRIVVR